ncbi:MAG: C4-dicarboxylate ABC transporter [Deltaproteobacteria bacterium]|nr:C4-dicarboxylate ABC transporter [Deltaproteobacteria bacterium]
MQLIARWMVVLAALAGLGMVVMVSVGVVMRYFLNSPLNFTEEVVGLLLSASLFLMLPYLTLHDKHVQITLLTQHPAEKIRWVLKILKQLVTLAFFAWMLYETVPWLQFAIKLNLKTEISRLSLLPSMAILPISFFLTCAASLLRLWQIRRSSQDSSSAG